MVSNGTTVAATDFSQRFDALKEMINEEWPQVEKAALDKTKGDLNEVVALVSNSTEHTKTLVKKQLTELYQLAEGKTSRWHDVEQRAKRLLEQLEGKQSDVARYVKEDILPEAESKVKDNLLTSLLVTLGFGFLIGFIFRGLGRGR